MEKGCICKHSRSRPGSNIHLTFLTLNPFPNDKFWTLPNEKILQMTISNLIKMVKKVLKKWVENIAGKGEIAHYEQFLLFPQCFRKSCNADKYQKSCNADK